MDKTFRSKMKVTRDPTSHRLIEKRRRDRMNSCLADLSTLIPTTYIKKGRGRMEKTEIIELAIKHLKQLQSVLSNQKLDVGGHLKDFGRREQLFLGYQECLHETTCYLVENEGLMLGDPLCVALLTHLKQHGQSIYEKRNFVDEEEFFHGSNSLHSQDSANSLESDVDNADYPHVQPHNSSSGQSVVSEEDECADQPRSFALNVSKMEGLSWHELELSKSPRLEPEVEVGNIGGMSTCSSNRSDEVYKYKRNIKERFHADQKIKSDEPRTRSSSLSLLDVPNKRKHSRVTSETKRIKTESVTEVSDAVRGCAVPIFALHPEHAYYVPMTIDSALILPQLNALNDYPSAMHRIEISVSFATEYLSGNP